MRRLAPLMALIDRQVMLEGTFTKGITDDWYWMDNCQIRRRSPTLGDLEPRPSTEGYDDDAIFSMDM